MRLVILGTGYVGLTTAVGMALKGHSVACHDVVEEKLALIESGKVPIYEVGMEEALHEVQASGRLIVTRDLTSSVVDSDATFICVGTPSGDDGSADLTFLRSACRSVGEALRGTSHQHVVITKSTIPPTTTRDIITDIIRSESGRQDPGLGVVFSPEFLREGRALEDLLHPDRIVVGADTEDAGLQGRAVYDVFDAPLLRTSTVAAELIKYVSNSLLATKIAFSNEVGTLCKDLGIDVYDVMAGVGMDSRISPQFLNAGAGFGGSCFPKDIRALLRFAGERDVDLGILSSVLAGNEVQKTRLLDIGDSLGVDWPTVRVGLLGLAFKPGTDDIREAPSISLIRGLRERGVTNISAHDPKAGPNMLGIFPDLRLENDPGELVQASDVVLFVTEWPLYSSLDPSLFQGRTVLAGRKGLPEGVHSHGIAW